MGEINWFSVVLTPEITGWLASPVDGRVRRLVDKENGDENF